ncbi:hypothetical protein [Sphingopyxis sp. GC21]|uniref:hypothetical protein n=1 Tax=Sphingopyxis sp. GC21 TaxID=2933562 RepID=UPI0021E46340|nr:hypothetical protein [Sphingopyxis sp. GC21]
MDAVFDAPNEVTDANTATRSRASDWLWRPWYAKLWWAAIPIWWLGMAASARAPVLETFYDSAMAGFLNILFFPMTALMVLGIGYVQHLLERRPAMSNEEVIGLGVFPVDPFDDDWDVRKPGQPHPSVDIYDPRSGRIYIGNPISPNNGARINAS